MYPKRPDIANQKGVSIVAVIAIMLLLSVMGVTLISLVTTGSDVSINQLQSEQAFNVAEGGIERALDAFYNNKTGCTSLSLTSSLGSGSFTTSGTLINPLPVTSLSAGITNLSTVIPVASTAGYENSGRIWIDSEQIIYMGQSSVAADCAPFGAPCFTGASRGVDGTTADTHALGATVQQEQCRIQSTGTITSSLAQRVAETGVQVVASDFLDGAATAVGVAETTIGTLPTTFPAGDNLIIVAVAFRNTTNTAANDIAAGNLRLKKAAVLLASNQSPIRIVGTAAPNNNNFPQETQFLLYKDIGAAANPTYDLTALAPVNNVITGEVKMIVINNLPALNSSFQDGVSVNMIAGAVETTILTHNSTVPKGDNIIIAAIQLDNPDNTTRTINAGGLRLKKGVATLASNQFPINLARSIRANRGTGVLLMARDVASAANPSYSVTGIDSTGGNPQIDGEAKIMVINGLASALLDTVSVPVGIAETVIGSLPTTFPAGENVIISATQFDNTVAAQGNIVAGNERIVANGTQSSNALDMNLCTSGTVECDDFADGLLWRDGKAAANPTYDVRALASAAGISGEAKIMAIHIKNKVPIYRKENY